MPNTAIKFSQKCVKGINDQIHAELTASYTYQTLSIHFSRHDIALANVASFFKKSSSEEQEHADKLIHYVQLRGGHVTLKDIKASNIDTITLLQAFEKTLELEKDVHKKILTLHDIANAEKEAHFSAFLEEEFLSEQIQAEDELLRMMSQIKRLGTGLGEYLFDRDLNK